MPNELTPSTAPGMPPWAMAAASYLARYSGNTLKTCTTSLRLGPRSRYRRAANAA